MDFHYNEGVEICLLETGSMRFAVDDQTYPLRAGDLTITRPWQGHRQGDPHIAAGRLHWVALSVGADRPDQGWDWPAWIVLSRKDQAELTRRLRLTETSVWRAPPGIVQSFQQIAAGTATKKGDRRVSAVAVGLNQLLLGVLDMLRAANRPERAGLASPERSVELFLDDLRHNLNSLEKSWTLEAMAHACGMGTTALSLLCRRLTNDSPIRYLNLARLEAAGRLLRGDPCPECHRYRVRLRISVEPIFRESVSAPFWGHSDAISSAGGALCVILRSGSLNDRAGKMGFSNWKIQTPVSCPRNDSNQLEHYRGLFDHRGRPRHLRWNGAPAGPPWRRRRTLFSRGKDPAAWPIIGLAMFAANISTVHLVSLAAKRLQVWSVFGNSNGWPALPWCCSRFSSRRFTCGPAWRDAPGLSRHAVSTVIARDLL